jgi:ankyrin repeat protein
MLGARGGHTQTVRVLLGAGLELNAQNAVGDTALILATQAGASDVAELLLKAGAKRTLRNRDGQSAADVAAARGFDALAARLAAG